MIKILSLSNSSRGMSIKMPPMEELINKAIKENDIDEENIINIQFISRSEVTIIYKI